MTVINTYDQWKEQKLEDTPNNKKVTCPDCNGETVIYTQCLECENETEKVCYSCDEGRVRFGDLTKNQIENLFTKDAYFLELYQDLKRLESWSGVDAYQVLIDNGYNPYTSLRKHYKSNKLSRGYESVIENDGRKEYKLH